MNWIIHHRLPPRLPAQPTPVSFSSQLLLPCPIDRWHKGPFWKRCHFRSSRLKNSYNIGFLVHMSVLPH